MAELIELPAFMVVSVSTAAFQLALLVPLAINAISCERQRHKPLFSDFKTTDFALAVVGLVHAFERIIYFRGSPSPAFS